MYGTTGNSNAPNSPYTTSTTSTNQRRFNIFPSSDAFAARRISDAQIFDFYPVVPPELSQDKSMLHPAAYLPPRGTYFNYSSPTCITPEHVGKGRCRNCFRLLQDHQPPIANQLGFQCPDPCAFATVLNHPAHPGQPCPQAYITARAAGRRWGYDARDPWYPIQMFPSEIEWKILQANGYITPNSEYRMDRTPVFTEKCWTLINTKVEEHKPGVYDYQPLPGEGARKAQLNQNSKKAQHRKQQIQSQIAQANALQRQNQNTRSVPVYHHGTHQYPLPMTGFYQLPLAPYQYPPPMAGPYQPSLSPYQFPPAMFNPYQPSSLLYQVSPANQSGMFQFGNASNPQMPFAPAIQSVPATPAIPAASATPVMPPASAAPPAVHPQQKELEDLKATRQDCWTPTQPVCQTQSQTQLPGDIRKKGVFAKNMRVLEHSQQIQDQIEQEEERKRALGKTLRQRFNIPVEQQEQQEFSALGTAATTPAHTLKRPRQDESEHEYRHQQQVAPLQSKWYIPGHIGMEASGHAQPDIPLSTGSFGAPNLLQPQPESQHDVPLPLKYPRAHDEQIQPREYCFKYEGRRANKRKNKLKVILIPCQKAKSLLKRAPRTFRHHEKESMLIV
ncbi:Nn.00g100120.m01.CDS01 [Neocucurbitaria sp. VM-36]